MSMDELHEYPITQHVRAFEGKAALAYPSVGKSGIFVQAPADKGFLGLSFLTGLAACKTATAPIDRVKLLIQNDGGIIVDGRLSEPYKGIRNCFWRTTMKEGFASLWRGNTANVIRYVPGQALTFGFWDFYKTKFTFKKDEVGYFGWSAKNFTTGSLAGCSSIFYVHPVDYVRTRLAMDVTKGGERQFKGCVDLCKKTLAADGIAGFYRGFDMSLPGAGIYRGLYFGMYESLKPVVLTGKMQDSFFGCFGVAWLSAIFAGSLSNGIDFTRRGMMMMSGEFKSTEAVLMLVLRPIVERLKVPGPKTFIKVVLRGAGANIPRAIVGAAALAAYDKLNPFNISRREYDDDAIDWV